MNHTDLLGIDLPHSQQKTFKLACESEATVLLTGPTGSGKSYWAQQIHLRSRRRSGPWVSVNLASLHLGTLESELFGHEKGAFTHAQQSRIGFFELAQGGTLFLDEIAELPIHLQSRLLQFLQDKTLSAVGSSRLRKLNVRIIAATNRDLEKAVNDGTFREDLYFRLRILSLPMKSLNERWDEFDTIVHNLLSQICHEQNRRILKISAAAADHLEAYPWPGNIRELRNALEYAILSCQNDSLEKCDLPHWLITAATQQKPSAHIPSLGKLQLDLSLDYHGMMSQFEREYLSRALMRFRGRINLTARQTGLSKTTLIRRVRSLNLLEGEPWQKAI